MNCKNNLGKQEDVSSSLNNNLIRENLSPKEEWGGRKCV